MTTPEPVPCTSLFTEAVSVKIKQHRQFHRSGKQQIKFIGEKFSKGVLPVVL